MSLSTFAPGLGSSPTPDDTPTETTMLRAVYAIRCSPNEAEPTALAIALEQTVEVPESLITCDRIRQEVMGRVESITAVAGHPDRFEATIAYPADLAAGSLAQTLNLLYGNISMKRDVYLKLVDWPAELLRDFRGPTYGIDGIRRLCGAFGRPLLATALKPRGSSHEDLARLAHDFAAGGGDLVKDDHNLVERSIDEFRDRVERCHEATVRGSKLGGGRTLYFPNLTGSLDRLEEQAEFCFRLGIPGVLIPPMICGLDTVRSLARRYPMAYLAHPTFSGTFFHSPDHGIAPGLLLGTLFRLAGCDGVVFPNHGGRFTFDQATCGEIVAACREPLGDIRPAFPAPAGGMSFETIPRMAADYGRDTMFLIGGGLLAHSESLRESTARFRDAIDRLFPDQSPADEHVSACELPSSESRVKKAHVREFLKHTPDYRWDGRQVAVYKASQELPFKNVERIELVGPHGEQTAFDLRYFEIGAGGYSSRERHRHTHVVIGVRGVGHLDSGENTYRIEPGDIAYVPPMQPHQLRNDAADPFGFYCIVDHTRDRPTAVTAVRAES